MNRFSFRSLLIPLSLVMLGWLLVRVPEARTQAGHTRFAVIGDYGFAGLPEQDVANLVKRWNPDFILTTGDNNYPSGAASTIDQNIGQYYHDYLSPYTGVYGAGASVNRFFPTLGNHDWEAAGAMPYLDYFTLPGNERYYDVVRGPVHLFVIDSDPHEPDGNTSASTQAVWLQSQLASSAAPWKLIYFHHPPYSSGEHGSNAWMQWPFQTWGASAVLAGHDHDYERIVISGFPYFVNGLGGRSIYSFGAPVPGSQVRYNNDYGAMLVDADESHIVFQFISRNGTVVDSFAINSCGGSSISPAQNSFSESGGVGSLSITASEACSWTANSNDSWISINSSGAGSGAVNYSIAHNPTASPRSGRITVSEQTFTVYQAAQFNDVPSSHPFYLEISKISARGLSVGCGYGNFCPDGPVTREQMAIFIERALGAFTPPSPPPGQQTFADVPPTRTSFAFIEEFAKRGITSGCGGGNYCPDAQVTREQMAAFIIRALGDFNPPTPASQRFADVPSANQFYKFIDEMAARGVTQGCGSDSNHNLLYCPQAAVTRGQMAAILARAFGL